MFGANIIDVPVKSYMRLLFEEVSNESGGIESLTLSSNGKCIYLRNAFMTCLITFIVHCYPLKTLEKGLKL